MIDNNHKLQIPMYKFFTRKKKQDSLFEMGKIIWVTLPPCKAFQIPRGGAVSKAITINRMISEIDGQTICVFLSGIDCHQLSSIIINFFGRSKKNAFTEEIR